MTKPRPAGSPKRAYGERETNRLIGDYRCSVCQGVAYVERSVVRVNHDMTSCALARRLRMEHPGIYSVRA